MKKFLSTMLLAFLLVIVGSQAEASDYYVGTFNVSRAKGYIMTETIRRTGETTYEATLKAVYPDGQIDIIYYEFDDGDDSGLVGFRNSDGNRGRFKYHMLTREGGYATAPVSDKYPVEYGMYRYIITHR